MLTQNMHLIRDGLRFAVDMTRTWMTDQAEPILPLHGTTVISVGDSSYCSRECLDNVMPTSTPRIFRNCEQMRGKSMSLGKMLKCLLLHRTVVRFRFQVWQMGCCLYIRCDICKVVIYNSGLHGLVE